MSAPPPWSPRYTCGHQRRLQAPQSMHEPTRQPIGEGQRRAAPPRRLFSCLPTRSRRRCCRSCKRAVFWTGIDRSLDEVGAWSFCGPSTPRALPVARLLTELGLSSAEAMALEEENLGVVGQAVDQRDGAGGVGEDSVPSFEGQVGGDQQGAVLVATADELEDQVGGASVVAEVAHLRRRPGSWAGCSAVGGVRGRGRSPAR